MISTPDHNRIGLEERDEPIGEVADTVGIHLLGRRLQFPDQGVRLLGHGSPSTRRLRTQERLSERKFPR
jgi:hypothetical protein